MIPSEILEAARPDHRVSEPIHQAALVTLAGARGRLDKEESNLLYGQAINAPPSGAAEFRQYLDARIRFERLLTE